MVVIDTITIVLSEHRHRDETATKQERCNEEPKH